LPPLEALGAHVERDECPRDDMLDFYDIATSAWGLAGYAMMSDNTVLDDALSATTRPTQEEVAANKRVIEW
jgi:hypothetical protein